MEDTLGFTGTSESYSVFVERIYQPSYRRHADSQFLAAFEGAWVGLSSFAVKPGGEGMFGLTAVTRAHRGKGLARALKVEALSYAQRRGIKRVTTENHPKNTPILRLNRALGFAEDCS